MPDRPDNAAAAERRWFGVLCLLLGSYYVWLQLSRRIPANHDSLDVYLIQQLFLGQSSREDGLLLWLPYSFHGVLSSWLVGVGGMLHSAAVLVGAGRDGANSRSLFNLGMLFEDLMLLVGMWRLSRIFLRTPPARCLATLWAVGSSFWAQQMWHNHRPVFAVPLILSLFHDFLEDGGRRPLFLAVNLLFLQFLGNLPYVAVMTHAIVGLYLGVFVLIHRRRLRPAWPKLRPRLSDTLVLLPNLILLFCIHRTLTTGTSEVTMRLLGRAPDSTVSLTGFLAYPGELDPVRFADLLLGISPSMDYTLYCGIAAVPFAVLAVVLRPGRKVFHLATILILTFLLSLGYLGAVGLPGYLLPPLRYFRYISLTAVHVRLPLILLASLGFEALLVAGRRDPVRLRAAVRPLVLIGLLCGILAVLTVAGRGEDLNLTRFLTTPNPRLAAFDDLGDAGLVRALGAASAAALGTAAILVGLLVRPTWRPALSMLLLAVLAGDVVRWRVMMTFERTTSLSAADDAALAIRPLPFVRRRSMEPGDPVRARLFAQPKPLEHAARYDTLENVIERDPPVSPFMTSHWMSSVDRLLRASVREPLDGAAAATPQAWRTADGALWPPYDRIIGQSAEKLQVFSGVRVVPTDQEAADLINASKFTGDALILTSPGPAPSGESRRVDAGVEVISFDANHLRAKVSLPAGLPGGWLLYCDAWHSHWTATVNGHDVPVARAFLAYKAVPLEKGTNVVEFRIRSSLRVWTFRLAAANAALWVLGLVTLAATSLRPGKDAAPASSSQAASGGA